MFRMSAKVVLFNLVFLDMPGGFLLMMLASVLVTIAFVSSWLKLTFQSPSKFHLHKLQCIQIVQQEVHQTPVDTLV